MITRFNFLTLCTNKDISAVRRIIDIQRRTDFAYTFRCLLATGDLPLVREFYSDNECCKIIYQEIELHKLGYLKSAIKSDQLEMVRFVLTLAPYSPDELLRIIQYDRPIDEPMLLDLLVDTLSCNNPQIVEVVFEKLIESSAFNSIFEILQKCMRKLRWTGILLKKVNCESVANYLEEISMNTDLILAFHYDGNKWVHAINCRDEKLMEEINARNLAEDTQNYVKIDGTEFWSLNSERTSSYQTFLDRFTFVNKKIKGTKRAY